MRLESLCELKLAYKSEFTLVRPYGTEEGTGYGFGDGELVGDRLSGKIEWVNHPHRRSDGRLLPDVHGIVRTNDGVAIAFTMRGRTKFEANSEPTSSKGRQALVLLFEAQDERYQWLNDAVCVVDGVIESMKMRAKVYVCVHQME